MRDTANHAIYVVPPPTAAPVTNPVANYFRVLFN